MARRNVFSVPSSHVASTPPQIAQQCCPSGDADSAIWYEAPHWRQVMSDIFIAATPVAAIEYAGRRDDALSWRNIAGLFRGAARREPGCAGQRSERM